MAAAELRTMRLVLPLPLLLLAAAAEVPFETSGDSFADAAACRAQLVALAAQARADNADAVEGPYEIAAGDVRIHSVRAEGAGHRIAEHRCLAERLGSRSWTHQMEDRVPAFSVESAARDAAWLQKDRPQQQQ
jgi:hypothetical protein